LILEVTMYRMLIWTITASCAMAQTQVDLRTQAKQIDFTAAAHTKPVKTGSTLPASCTIGEMLFLTSAPAGANLYACAENNQWALQGQASAACAVDGSSGKVVFAAASCSTFSLQLNGTPVTSATFTGASSGATYTIVIAQDATGGRPMPSPTNWSAPCPIDTTPSATTTEIGWFDGARLNIYTCSYSNKRSIPYIGSFTGTTVTIPAGVHGQGSHPFVRVYDSTGYEVSVPSYCLTSAGTKVGCADTTSSGDIVVAQVTSGSYTYGVYGLNSPGPPGPAGPQGPASPADFALTKTSNQVITVAGGNFRYGTNFVHIPAAMTFGLQTVPIASITTGNTTQITTAAPITNLANGQAVNLQLNGTGSGCAPANGVFTATYSSPTQFTIPVNTSAGCSGASGMVGAATSGVAVIYANSSGQIEMDHSAALGALAYASGEGAVVNQSATATFPNGSVPLGYITIANGGFDRVTDYRAALYSMVVQSGQGVDVTTSGGQAVVSVASNVAQVDQPSVWVNSVDMHGATRTLPWRTGTGSPTARDNCVVPGEAYFQTDGPFLWVCTTPGSPGTWARANSL
jgi:hypothetical protein